jgi:hypothetical protein
LKDRVKVEPQPGTGQMKLAVEEKFRLGYGEGRWEDAAFQLVPPPGPPRSFRAYPPNDALRKCTVRNGGGGSTGDRNWNSLFPAASYIVNPELMPSERDMRACGGRASSLRRGRPVPGKRKPLSGPTEPDGGSKENLGSCAACKSNEGPYGLSRAGSKRRTSFIETLSSSADSTSFIQTLSSSTDSMLPICPIKLLPGSHTGGSGDFTGVAGTMYMWAPRSSGSRVLIVVGVKLGEELSPLSGITNQGGDWGIWGCGELALTREGSVSND